MFIDISEATIKEWKDKYGEDGVLCLSLKEGKVYLLNPEKSSNLFHMTKRAITAQNQGDPLEAGEIIFNECYLGGLGDKKDINKNSLAYISTCMHCTNLIDVMEGNFTVV